MSDHEFPKGLEEALGAEIMKELAQEQSEELENVQEDVSEAADEEIVEETIDDSQEEESLQEEALEAEIENQVDFDEEHQKILNEAIDMGFDPNKFPKDHPRYISPHEYVRYGKLQEANRKQAEEHAKQLESFKALMEAKASQKIEEAKAAMKLAEENYDLDEYKLHEQALRQAEYEKATLDGGVKAAQVLDKDPYMVEWESKNEWIFDPNSVQAIEAKSLYEQAVRAGATTVKAALDYVDSKMGLAQQAEQPVVNPRREVKTVSNAPKEPRQVKGKQKLNWGDLSRDEQSFFKTSMDVWRSINPSDPRAAYLDAIKAEKSIN